MKLIAVIAGVCAGATVLAGCGGSSGAGKGDNGAGGKVVSGGTFTFAMNSDPGNLDPQASAASNLFQITKFAYDSLVNVADGGKIVSGLAKSWQVDGTKLVLTLHPGITCSDGSAFTATDAAANLNYIADAKNKSPFLGVFVPAGAKATADATAGTVTLTTPKLAPFLLDGLGNTPMVCAKGMQDRKSIARQTDGTGPFQLSEAVSGDHYTYTKRAGYSWGPDGAATATKGVPDKVIVKIIPNATTAANLLLTGAINAATIVGSDQGRMEQAKLFATDSPAPYGEMWFNEATGRPAADHAVREAMVRALDLGELAKVLTAGTGTPGTTFAASAPVGCPGNSVAAALPQHDMDKAKQLLDDAGWKPGSDGTRSKDGKPLALTFMYNTELGEGGSAAAELAVKQWQQLGIKITTKPKNETAAVDALFSTGDWDVSWESLVVSTPDQIVPFMSGPAAPNGTNFGHISNAAYEAGVAKASTIPGTEGCSEWLNAEANLVSNSDVIPFANQVIKTYGKGVKFDFIGDLVPTSIRMLAG